jgi:hypothetical protein
VADLTEAWFEHCLDALIGEWGEMADEYIAEWSDYDLEVRGIIIEDWPSHNDMMADVERFARENQLTAEQRARYLELHRLIASKHQILTSLGFRLRPLTGAAEKAA